MRQFTNAERRARLARRHHLVAKEADVATVARSLIGLHGTDPVSIFLAARARMKKASVDTIEHAFYEERSVVRMLAMRRTLFVVPVDLVPVVQAAASDAVAANERKKLVQLIDAAGWTKNASKWIDKVSEQTVAVAHDLGSATAAEISARVPDLDRKVLLGPGTKWAAEQPVGLRIVPLLGVEGRLARGRPKGSWISTQHRWEPMANWTDAPPIARDTARTELVTRWLRAFGPAPVSDIKWWTGWSLGDVRRALAEADVVDVEIEGVSGVALADDLNVVKPVKPWVALLPSLDPTVMAWQERTWFIGDRQREIFDTAGNAGPTVWWDGHVVGVWTQLPSGEIAWRVFTDVGAVANAAIAKEVAALEKWLGPTRFTPRFGPRWVAGH